MSHHRIAAIVLAAGASSRLGEPKQLLRDGDAQTLVARAAQCALDAGADPVVVVTGANAVQVRDALAALPVSTTFNERWADGMSTSIVAGVRAVSELAPTSSALLLMTCDMPSITSAHLHKLFDRFHNGALRVASAYGNTFGVPAVIGANEWSELLQLTGDRGAKSLLSRAATETVPLDGGLLDIDTSVDLARWRLG